MITGLWPRVMTTFLRAYFYMSNPHPVLLVSGLYLPLANFTLCSPPALKSLDLSGEFVWELIPKIVSTSAALFYGVSAMLAIHSTIPPNKTTATSLLSNKGRSFFSHFLYSYVFLLLGSLVFSLKFWNL